MRRVALARFRARSDLWGYRACSDISPGQLRSIYLVCWDKVSLVRWMDLGALVKPSAEIICSGLPVPLLSQRSLMPSVQPGGCRSSSQMLSIRLRRSYLRISLSRVCCQGKLSLARRELREASTSSGPLSVSALTSYQHRAPVIGAKVIPGPLLSPRRYRCREATVC